MMLNMLPSSLLSWLQTSWSSSSADQDATLYNKALIGFIESDNSSLASTDVDSEGFDVSLLGGFLPDSVVTRLPGKGAAWEEIWEASAGIGLHSIDLRAVRWRKRVEQLPVIELDPWLDSLPLLRRAHSLLAFIMHRYVHSLPKLAEGEVPVVPDGIARPLLEVSRRLDMPPILTYADTVLWNYRLRDPHAGFTFSNLDILLSFSGTADEAHFYLVSAIIEKVGAPALRIMSATLDEAWLNDTASRSRIVDYLHALAPHIDACTAVVRQTRSGCAPATFYHEIRPWFNGGERVLAGERVAFGGPSAGQSTLVHAFDVFLGINHSSDDEDSNEATFMTRMGAYMPSEHRQLLRYLQAESSSVRLLAEESAPLRAAYDECIVAMKKLREAHTALVSSYILRFVRGGESAIGTGGSKINEFLSRTRKATMDALFGR